MSRWYLPLLLLLTAGCQPRLYFPDRANAPGLSEAYEGKVVVSLKPQSTDKDSLGVKRGQDNSFSFDAAFAPADHIGIIASYRRLNHKYLSENFDLYDWGYGGDYTGNRYEVGAGYFDRIGGKGRFDIYLGYGNGSLERVGWQYPLRNFTVRYHRFFLQPSLGVGNDIFLINGGFRLAWHTYYDFQSPDPALRYTILSDNSDIQGEVSGFVEPFINMEVGYKFARFNFQTGWSTQLFGSRVGAGVPFYASLGLVVHIKPSYFMSDK